MKQNVNLAPQTGQAAELYAVWRRDHIGTRADFREFLTTPSPERDSWLSGRDASVSVDGPAVSTIYG